MNKYLSLFIVKRFDAIRSLQTLSLANSRHRQQTLIALVSNGMVAAEA
jgi:hypothetical protein